MCGIVGISCDNKDAAKLAALGLFALQHRGQESCGIAVSDDYIKLHKGMGLVKDVFKTEILDEMLGNLAIGHVRYPTCGVSKIENSQPHKVETLFGPIHALASNGDIINYKENREELINKNVHFKSDNDGELLLRFLVYYIEQEKFTPIEAIKNLMSKIKGAFSSVFLHENKLYAFRDPFGIRPMVLGKLTEQKGYIVASEICALDIVQAEFIKEVSPGEILIIDSEGYESIMFDNRLFKKESEPETAHCIFELIYFSRPDGFEFNEYVYKARLKLGEMLAEKEYIDADVVMPVPDSSNYIALGFAEKSKIPFSMGLVRNHYVGRTFIKPEQRVRDEAVIQKFNPLKDFLNGKKVILVDDSIVRGTTLKNLISTIKIHGAKEVHLRIGSPMVKHPCFYGIDTPSYEELIANKMTLEEIRDFIGADSLNYLTVDELRKCVEKPESFCYACFTGNYPLAK